MTVVAICCLAMASVSAALCGTSACLQAFAQVQRSLSTTSADFSTQISSSALQDEVGRLRVWAANIGALQKGHSSLDYRLREASLVRENVLKLLKELHSALQEGEYFSTLWKSPLISVSKPGAIWNEAAI